MSIHFEDSGQRATALKTVRRVVVKVGTRLLTGIDGCSKDERVSQLVAEVAALRGRGLEVIVVTSGAIGAGIVVLNTPKRPQSLPQLQAHAAVGQCRLMYLYEKACAEHGFHCAQMLLTAADVQNRERHLNIRSCLDALFANGVLPVINENDSVSIDEIRFGDNDCLASLVATMARAELTILLTSIDGLRENLDGQLGRRYSVVAGIDDTTRGMAKDTEDRLFSVGGMKTKLLAADTVTKAGEHLWIADGRDFAVLRAIFAAQDVGTLFLARKNSRMRGPQRYLAFFSKPAGELTVDEGAARAIREQGRSLLPSGIVAVAGSFRRGDTVRIVAADGNEIARGVSHFEADEVRRIRGQRTDQIRALLGYEGADAVVHRNDMVVH